MKKEKKKMKFEINSIICATYDNKAECWDLPFNMRTEAEVEHRRKKLEEVEANRYELYKLATFENGKIKRWGEK